MPTETIPFDAAPYFPDTASREQLLADAFATSNAGYIAATVGTIARARGMAQVARDAAVSRYKALSPEGDPQLLGVLNALGVKLSVSFTAADEPSAS